MKKFMAIVIALLTGAVGLSLALQSAQAALVIEN
jgi:hypothetical protein